MYFKGVVICASVLLIQSISAQCCNNVIIAPPCANIYTRPSCASLTVSPCQLPGAPNIPAGMSICSDNLLINGPVVVAGKLPFSGTVALEGALPAYGAGLVSYGCGGCGEVAIVTEGPISTGIVRPCGCGGYY